MSVQIVSQSHLNESLVLNNMIDINYSHAINDIGVYLSFSSNSNFKRYCKITSTTQLYEVTFNGFFEEGLSRSCLIYQLRYFSIKVQVKKMT